MSGFRVVGFNRDEESRGCVSVGSEDDVSTSTYTHVLHCRHMIPIQVRLYLARITEYARKHHPNKLTFQNLRSLRIDVVPETENECVLDSDIQMGRPGLLSFFEGSHHKEIEHLEVRNWLPYPLSKWKAKLQGFLGEKLQWVASDLRYFHAVPDGHKVILK